MDFLVQSAFEDSGICIAAFTCKASAKCEVVEHVFEDIVHDRVPVIFSGVNDTISVFFPFIHTPQNCKKPELLWGLSRWWL